MSISLNPSHQIWNMDGLPAKATTSNDGTLSCLITDITNHEHSSNTHIQHSHHFTYAYVCSSDQFIASGLYFSRSRLLSRPRAPLPYGPFPSNGWHEAPRLDDARCQFHTSVRDGNDGDFFKATVKEVVTYIKALVCVIADYTKMSGTGSCKLILMHQRSVRFAALNS
jgi:hypothetical protein